MAYKPILFSTQMILQLPQMGGNKSMTRRVCKNFPEGAHDFEYNEDGTLAIMAGSIENGVCWDGWKEVKPPYMVGDILWVRETYKIDYLSSGGCFGKIKYRADESYKDSRLRSVTPCVNSFAAALPSHKAEPVVLPKIRFCPPVASTSASA